MLRNPEDSILQPQDLSGAAIKTPVGRNGAVSLDLRDIEGLDRRQLKEFVAPSSTPQDSISWIFGYC